MITAYDVWIMDILGIMGELQQHEHDLALDLEREQELANEISAVNDLPSEIVCASVLAGWDSYREVTA